MIRDEARDDGRPLGRRALLRRAAGGLGAAALLAAGGAGGGRAAAAGAPQPLEVSYWRRVQGPYCSGGEVREYWCLYSCAGASCEVVTCEWRTTGSC